VSPGVADFKRLLERSPIPSLDRLGSPRWKPGDRVGVDVVSACECSVSVAPVRSLPLAASCAWPCPHVAPGLGLGDVLTASVLGPGGVLVAPVPGPGDVLVAPVPGKPPVETGGSRGC